MLEKITIWFDKLSTSVKALISIGTAVTVISGFLALHDAKVIKGYKDELSKQTAVSSLRSLQMYQIRDSIGKRQIIFRIDSLINITSSLSSDINSRKEVDENLKKWFIENAATKADILRIIEVFNEKKK